jgi:hypothetical protein
MIPYTYRAKRLLPLCAFTAHLSVVVMKTGGHTRKQRKKLGFNSRELGERTSLMGDSLSQIENDQTSSSLNSFQTIAATRKVPMFHLIIASPTR